MDQEELASARRRLKYIRRAMLDEVWRHTKQVGCKHCDAIAHRLEQFDEYCYVKGIEI